MTEPYSPIMRAFCQFRAGVLNCLDVARHDVRPGTPREALLPVSGRRRVWQELRRINPPYLTAPHAAAG